MSIKKVLKERASRYGEFGELSKTSQELKTLMGEVYLNADPTVCEALDMVLHKLARISNTPKGWLIEENIVDTIGYLELWLKHLHTLPNTVYTEVKYSD